MKKLKYGSTSMDNCKSEPFKNLKEQDLLPLVEYIDVCYRWIEFFQKPALDAMVKIVTENKSFEKWLAQYIFKSSYRLYVGKEFRIGEKKLPKVGTMVERSGNKSHNWTTKFLTAVEFSEVDKGKEVPEKYLGGLVGKCVNSVNAHNIIADMVRLFDFFATDDMHGPEVYNDIDRLARNYDAGKKLKLVIDRFYNSASKVRREQEVITTGNINVYEVVAAWEVNPDTLKITTTGDWGS
jgi:hypothetical protein